MVQPPTRPNPSNAITLPSKRNRLSPPILFAWGLVAFALLLTVWSILNALPRLVGHINSLQLLSQILFRVIILAFAVLAALVIARQPRNAIGWLMVLPVLGGTLAWFSEPFLANLTEPPASLSQFLFVLLWIDNTAWTLLVFPILLIPLLFPTGQPPSRRWNWVIGYTLVWLLVYYGVGAFAQQIGPLNATWLVTNPHGFIPADLVNALFGVPWLIALAVLALVCVAALIVRDRRGSSVEKAQIKWVVYASAIFAFVYVAVLPINTQSNGLMSDLANLLFAIIVFIVPASIGIAILRYRLWDIDFVINRSLVYGALTVALVTLFGLSLLVIQSLFQNLPGGPLIALVIAAAVFGAFFQPARRRLQRFVDQRFYNIQIDYNQTPAPVVSSLTGIFKHTHFGDYQNLELIGQGGMAEVYKSIHPTLGLPVAIKILPASLATDPDFQRRFVREAQTVANLHHPHIIRVFDHGELNGLHYMVMEYIAGKDLGDYLTRHGRLTLAQALPLLRGLADALDYAHTQGLVHRDIKPSNLLLDTAGASPDSSPALYRAVLTDFGIAKILSGVTRYTATGSMVGTLDYIAPEQIQGAADVDSRADVYASGILAYQTLTGVLPFQHHNPGALLMAHLLQPPPDPRNLAPHLSPQSALAIQRAMAKNPHDRFATVGEFIKALV